MADIEKIMFKRMMEAFEKYHTYQKSLTQISKQITSLRSSVSKHGDNVDLSSLMNIANKYEMLSQKAEEYRKESQNLSGEYLKHVERMKQEKEKSAITIQRKIREKILQ